MSAARSPEGVCVGTALAHPAPPELAHWTAQQHWRSFTDGSPALWRFSDNGRAGPALVLLPGALGDAASAWRIAEAFDAQQRVIAITYPGGLDAVALADGLSALLRELNAGAVALWGSSYGAWWAQAFAQRHPQQLRALWLGNTFSDGDDLKGAALFDADWLQAASSAEVLARWDQALAARPDDELRAVQLHMLHRVIPVAQLHGRLRQVSRAPLLPAAGTVSRTVICHCDDDLIIGPAVRARVLQRYPEARQVHLPRGGHYPHIVSAPELVQAMQAWLAAD
ncbi:alpha/beta fold hydrolase [Xenophilus sp. Marseille-Q4582]|uniref:alpha/beta fold hydrolase n=1 Tax=Xenophilus sp. Marseille-Q4582 TaxID=2866600 RepID=UPI001CE416E1|nr:alpha/beta hydrolase [Xenophilus sp. Marseille-Q4582]